VQAARRGLALRPPGPACLAFRPHAVRLDATATPGGEGLAFDGTVAATSFQGDSLRYRVRVGGADVIAEETHRRGAAGWRDGAPVRLRIEAAELRLIAV
jgi:ABC-type Fe3+/spermidine/putrescine transport system ATPase subunit